MTNILPGNARSRMLRATRAKFFFMTALVMSIVACIAILSVLPAFFLAYIPRESLSATQANPETDPAQTEEDRASAGRARSLVSALTFISDEKVPVSDIVPSILEALPDGVVVERMTYRSGSPGTIVLTGTAESREQVNAYRDALLTIERLSDVSVPVSALVGTLAGSFTVTIRGTF